MNSIERKFSSYQGNIITKLDPFNSRDAFPCPPRFEINVYSGCSYRCQYCYSWYIPNFGTPTRRGNFKSAFERDLKKVKRKGLDDLLITLSYSGEPLQPIETMHQHTLYALQQLMDENFNVLLLTKNPYLLLEDAYQEALHPENVVIQVTVPFLKRRPFEVHAPPLHERIKAIGKLIDLGFSVTARVDPLIPRTQEVKGQSEDEIEALVERLHREGVNHIVGKSLRLVEATGEIYPNFYYGPLREFYKEKGDWTGNHYEPREKTQEHLLSPLYKACKKYGINLSSCLDQVGFENVASCDKSAELLERA